MSEPWMTQENAASRAAWEANAAFWDDYMGTDGNSFVRELIWPAVKELLDSQPGQRILDAACGNGMYTRKLADLGAQVVGFDFSANLIERAQGYPPPERGAVDYLVGDATDESGLLNLGERSFDAASCQMALFDMPEIAPLLRALAKLLKPGAPFVASITHPVFNQAGNVFSSEMIDDGGTLVTSYCVKIARYMTARSELGSAIKDQPVPQPYFDRPLQEIVGAGFEAGFVLDGLLERAFPAGEEHKGRPLSWGPNFSEIPPVMVLRFRLPEA